VISFSWPRSPLRDTIAADEVHLWAWLLGRSAPELLADLELLDEQELQRRNRYHFAADRDRYTAAHGNLRRVLGGYLKRAPEEIRFCVNRFGKPGLTDPSSALSFNLSHSKTFAIVAVAYGSPVGVDVEDIRPIEPEVADGHFSPAELSQLRKFEGDAWLTAFYRCWTRKEAVVKAEGLGLSLSLDSFDVGLSAKAELLGMRQTLSRPWKLHDVSPSRETIGALATIHNQPRLSYFSL
jgi:4'-phosphopantetheinyl transferase